MSTTPPLPRLSYGQIFYVNLKLGGNNMVTSLKDILQAPSSDPRGTCLLDLPGFPCLPARSTHLPVWSTSSLSPLSQLGLGQAFCRTTTDLRFAKQVTLFICLFSDSIALTLALTFTISYTLSFGASRIGPCVTVFLSAQHISTPTLRFQTLGDWPLL